MIHLIMADLLPPGGVSTQMRSSPSEDASAGSGSRRGGSILGLRVRIQAEGVGGDGGGGGGVVGVQGRGDGCDGGDHGGRWLGGQG